MFLVRLIYASRISSHFQSDDIPKILESARVNNQQNNVTGMLCFNRKIFLQCLEGSRKHVNKTYHYILQDKRHDDILMLDYKEIISREFDSWTMGYVPEAKLTAPLNLRFSGNNIFDPYEMSGESAYQMLCALKDTVPSIA